MGRFRLLIVLGVVLLPICLYAWGPLPIAGSTPSDACASETTMGRTTSTGTATDSSGDTPPVSGLFTASCTGDLTDAHLFLRYSGTDYAKVCIYEEGDTDTTPDAQDSLVACSAIITGISSSTWYSNTFSSGTLTKDHKYWILIAPDTTYWSNTYDTYSGVDVWTGSASYYGEPSDMGTGTWPAPWQTDSAMAVYVHYQ